MSPNRNRTQQPSRFACHGRIFRVVLTGVFVTVSTEIIIVIVHFVFYDLVDVVRFEIRTKKRTSSVVGVRGRKHVKSTIMDLTNHNI